MCDHPTAEDSLGFGPYVEAIAAFLTSDATEPPLTISIEGEWGSGKSSFMLQLEKAIAGPSKRAVFFKELPTRMGGFTTPGSLAKAMREAWKHQTRPTIQFNAWRHDKQDALWAAFALSVSRRLRKRVGFLRAWWGDIRLFLLRLSGLRGWLELCLLLASILFLLLSVSFLCNQLMIHLFVNGHLSHDNLQALITQARVLVNPFADKKDPTAVNIVRQAYGSLLTKETATHGSWFALFILAIAGFVKFHKQLKLPISIDLKKYLAAPDYNGHTAFIESFHDDFARLVHAYAGNERVFIFIDDLDRCDVPRAAELMQAINLMISDAGRLIFILGMDREKVAAGITQKYKDLLPFLPEYAASLTPGQQTGTGSSPLSFGYSYLEKFIQLSFTLPVIADKAALDKFLDAMIPNAPPPTWVGQMNYYWGPKLAALRGRLPVSHAEPSNHAGPQAEEQRQTGNTPTTTSDQESIKSEKRIRTIRMQIAQDSEGVRSIVSMVSIMFENNPRRLKQFLSTFRLALALSSDQGILELDPEQSGVTPQQLGKFVALTMRFPDLRVSLAENPDLLGGLEKTARTWPSEATPDQQYWRWMHKKAIRGVLLYGVRETSSESENEASQVTNPFSLIGLDVSRLMTLLPKVPPPEPLRKPDESKDDSSRSAQPSEPGPNPKAPSEAAEPTRDELQQKFNALATEYVQIRKTQRASSDRTRNMTDLVNRVQAQIAEFSPQVTSTILKNQLNQDTDGTRIVALGIACERINQDDMAWLLQFLKKYHSPFEHYWTIRALLLHEKFFDEASAQTIFDTLTLLQSEIAKDPGRVNQAQALKARAQSRLVSSSAATKPEENS